MNWCRIISLVVILGVGVSAAPAGIFFNRKPKENPNDRVPTLINILKTESNENKRATAAEELRQFDADAFPQIVPALVESATHDPQVSVRLQSVQSLAKIRPVTQQAGWAIEQALHDPSMRVQIAARNGLLHYRMSGYHPTKSSEPPAPTRTIRTEEPPLASREEDRPAAVRMQPKTFPVAAHPPMPAQATPRPMPSEQPRNSPVDSRSMPAGQVQPTLIPTEPPTLEVPPKDDGPELTPQI